MCETFACVLYNCVQNSMFPQVYDGLNEDLTRLADKVAKKRLVVF